MRQGISGDTKAEQITLTTREPYRKHEDTEHKLKHYFESTIPVVETSQRRLLRPY